MYTNKTQANRFDCKVRLKFDISFFQFSAYKCDNLGMLIPKLFATYCLTSIEGYRGLRDNFAVDVKPG